MEQSMKLLKISRCYDCNPYWDRVNFCCRHPESRIEYPIKLGYALRHIPALCPLEDATENGR